jgi:hypothetical protein
MRERSKRLSLNKIIAVLGADAESDAALVTASAGREEWVGAVVLLLA